MTSKPFKAPSFVRRPDISANISSQEPPAKKRRVSSEAEVASTTEPRYISTQPVKSFRKPLLAIPNPASQETSSSQTADPASEGYYFVLWRKFSTKKHKTWDGDGILSVVGGIARLQDESGKDLGKTSYGKPLLPGSTLSVGGKDIEVDSIIPKADFLAGKPFLQNYKSHAPVSAPKSISAKPVKLELAPKEKKISMKSAAKQEKIEAKQVENVNVAAPTSKATKSQFKNPLLVGTKMARPIDLTVPVPRHDPKQAGSLVMKRPNIVPKGKQIVDVVVDPLLCKSLRPHQREGVSFLYECVMGMRSHGGEGAILADEMGLGKTLQTIALLWTLMKQNPIYEAAPVVKKALIVCPVTLINNWRKEFRKWLGRERIGVFVADGKFRVTDFTKGRAYNVMVIGYEKLRSVVDDLKQCSIDIVIADEGHRLKTAKNKSAEAIKSLNTERRIILSGTPVQNDLSEFFVMVDLVNPGLFSKYSTFKKEFETPIIKSQQQDATEKDREKGEGRSRELTELTGQFILRRTAEILSKYLPPKTEYVLFCRPTTAQATVYRSIVHSPVFGAALGSNEMALQLINILKKVCNSPSLLQSKANDEKKPSEMLASVLSSIPPQLLNRPGVSAKIQVLDSFLDELRNTTSEKVIIVSNYTSSLDMIGRLLTAVSLRFTRLDGSTPNNKRQDIIDHFNNTPAASCFAFLLSAKSGGAGLNLIGASRLILFDVDWNPATDLQAMARIHRDGQKRPCKIYRLLVKGALDEKIYQRQLTKMGLADAIVDNKATMSSFSKDELRKLFLLDEREECQTHTLLDCSCKGKGNVARDAVTDSTPSAGSAATDAIVLDSDDAATDDDDTCSLPDIASLQKASQINMEQQERRIKDAQRAKVADRERGSANVRSLMTYLHVDVKKLLKKGSGDKDGEDGEVEYVSIDDIEAEQELVEDQVLMNVLRREGCRVDFLFAKTTG